MNEFSENRNEIPKIQEFPQPSEHQNFSFNDLISEVNTFIDETNDFIKGLTTDTKETIKVREYGLQECTDAAKNIFTSKMFVEWGKMNVEQRNIIVQKYSKAIGDGLNIDFKGIVFEQMKKEIAGYNSGDGYVHLNNDLLKDPSKVICLLDTVAHEARHQFQFEAIRNPEKTGIDQATVNEWTAGLQNYTTQNATVYDPWGYHYNPVELDARYFGESMVRELTKDLINNSSIVESLQQKGDVVIFSGSASYHAKDADYHRGKAKDHAKAAATEQKKEEAEK